jgi:hypothetical protein
MLLRCVAATALCTLFLGCADDRERLCHIAAKSVVAAPENKARGEMDKLLSFGRYALPDIEQEFHAANATGRLRLLEVLRRLGLPEALPFLQVVVRWDGEEEVRRAAEEVARALDNATRHRSLVH